VSLLSHAGAQEPAVRDGSAKDEPVAFVCAPENLPRLSQDESSILAHLATDRLNRAKGALR
jgi:hypothetical protein